MAMVEVALARKLGLFCHLRQNCLHLQMIHVLAWCAQWVRFRRLSMGNVSASRCWPMKAHRLVVLDQFRQLEAANGIRDRLLRELLHATDSNSGVPISSSASRHYGLVPFGHGHAPKFHKREKDKRNLSHIRGSMRGCQSQADST
jgi:hypothetical protein